MFKYCRLPGFLNMSVISWFYSLEMGDFMDLWCVLRLSVGVSVGLWLMGL